MWTEYLSKTSRSLTGLVSTLVLLGALSVGLQTSAHAAVIVDQVGAPEPTGSTTLSGTLTGGFLGSGVNQLWSHTGYGVITETIVSATLTIDLIDAEDYPNGLDLYAGTSTAGTYFGTAYGTDDGKPGPWLGLGDSSDNVVNIAASLFSDIADGTFDIFGDNEGMIIWGSNRATLTITTEDLEISGGELTASVPEPAGLALFGLSLAGFGYLRRRRAA